jgi:hypothetical protein
MLTTSAVKAVEKEAKEMLKKEHPHLTDADLDISMSKKVKQDTERRIQRAGAEARGELWHPWMGVHDGDVGGGRNDRLMPHGMGQARRFPRHAFQARQMELPRAMMLGRPVAQQGRLQDNMFEDDPGFDEDDSSDDIDEIEDDEFAGFNRRGAFPQQIILQQHHQRLFSAGHQARPHQPQGRPLHHRPQQHQQAQPLRQWAWPVQQGNILQQSQANVFQNRANQQPSIFVGRGPATNQAGNAAAQRQRFAAEQAHIQPFNRSRRMSTQPEGIAGPSGMQRDGLNTLDENARNTANAQSGKKPAVNVFIGRRLGR